MLVAFQAKDDVFLQPSHSVYSQATAYKIGEEMAMTHEMVKTEVHGRVGVIRHPGRCSRTGS